MTFGYLHGPAPAAHLSVDLRTHFKDPHVAPDLRYLTACDERVRATVLATGGVKALIDAVAAGVHAYLAGPSGDPVLVAVGCAGGRHRAATVGMELARVLSARGIAVTLTHRDLSRPVIDRASSPAARRPA
jgi:RNase adaptor protein for sRNA GlmZ degradation